MCIRDRNLFDTIHDEGKNDYEYLPNSTNQWNTMKYKAKLKNMSEILSLLSTDKLPMGPAIIGAVSYTHLDVYKRQLQDHYH